MDAIPDAVKARAIAIKKAHPSRVGEAFDDARYSVSRSCTLSSGLQKDSQRFQGRISWGRTQHYRCPPMALSLRGREVRLLLEARQSHPVLTKCTQTGRAEHIENGSTRRRRTNAHGYQEPVRLL